MDLNQQMQRLIDEAPPESGLTPLLQVIAPVLLGLASHLQHSQYYIIQTFDQAWQTTTLMLADSGVPSRTVVYAYPTLADANAAVPPPGDPTLVALPLPVVDLIFQLLALETVDSLVFLETPGSPQPAVEIDRHTLRGLVQQQLRQLAGPPSTYA